MSRKRHLNRREKKGSSTDQWDHITGVEGYTTRMEIKDDMEVHFKEAVQDVSTLNVKGEVKRTVRGTSRAKNWKKAYVRIVAGQEIDFMVMD